LRHNEIKGQTKFRGVSKRGFTPPKDLYPKKLPKLDLTTDAEYAAI